jgi:hypothetical protein
MATDESQSVELQGRRERCDGSKYPQQDDELGAPDTRRDGARCSGRKHTGRPVVLIYYRSGFLNPAAAHEVQTEGYILIVVWESAGLRKGLVPERNDRYEWLCATSD